MLSLLRRLESKLAVTSKPRLVVDTNIIISGLLTTSTPPSQILNAIYNNKVILIVSDEIVTEYLRVLEYPHIRKYKKITDETIRDLACFFIENTERVEVFSNIKKSKDPDDNKFLSLAVDGQADFIVTGDKADLVSLNEVEHIPILTARLLVEKLKL